MGSNHVKKQRPVFHVFIDETGSFSYLSQLQYNKKHSTFVSGWVVAAEHVNKLDDILRGCVKDFNQDMAGKNVPGEIVYPQDLHFMPLHYQEQRTGQDSGISIAPGHIPGLITRIFNTLQDKVLLVFRSSGMPFIIPHEQAGYMEILRNTLVQLVHEPVFGKDFEITVTIGHRRSHVLYGDGFKDTRAYEKYLSNRLTMELGESFLAKPRPGIKILFGNARKLPGLILADFFCGSIRNKERHYLDNYPSAQIYVFSKGYSLVGGRAVQQLKFFETIDPVAASVQCLDMLSTDKDNPELLNLFEQMYKKLDQTAKKSFFESIQIHLNDIIVGNPERYAHLDRVKTMIDLLHSRILNKEPSSMSPDELRMMVDIQLNDIRIESHKGRTNEDMLKGFLSFLDAYGDLAFENQLTLMQRRLDAVLQGIQVSAFNTFRFDEVAGFLSEYRDRYLEMFRVELAREGTRDGNLARLEGTLGQMNGFLYDISCDPAHFKAAEDSLKNDIVACIPGTRVWEQGMGYLTALYWKKGDLDKALSQLLLEGGEPAMSSKDVYDLGKLDMLGCKRKPFIFMHRLNICALAQKGGKEIAGLDSAAGFLQQSNRLSQYPEMLSAKWLAILYAVEGDRRELRAKSHVYEGHDGLDLHVMEETRRKSLALLNEVLSEGDDSGYTLQVLRLPLKLCRHLILTKLGESSLFVCEQEVAHLELMQPGAEELLKKLGIEKYYGNPTDWDFYDIGTLLPFYYS